MIRDRRDTDPRARAAGRTFVAEFAVSASDATRTPEREPAAERLSRSSRYPRPTRHGQREHAPAPTLRRTRRTCVARGPTTSDCVRAGAPRPLRRTSRAEPEAELARRRGRCATACHAHPRPAPAPTAQPADTARGSTLTAASTAAATSSSGG